MIKSLTIVKNYFSDECRRCARDSVINMGHYSYCAYHYRLIRIRVDAKIKGKMVPTEDELGVLLDKHKDMICPVCKSKMNWLGRDGKKHVLTLQHNMDGTFGILCHSCNAAHQFIPNDGFYSKPAGTRFCQDCKEFLPLNSFFRDSRLNGGVKTYCKKCANARTYKWRREVQYKGRTDWNRF